MLVLALLSKYMGQSNCPQLRKWKKNGFCFFFLCCPWESKLFAKLEKQGWKKTNMVRRVRCGGYFTSKKHIMISTADFPWIVIRRVSGLYGKNPLSVLGGQVTVTQELGQNNWTACVYGTKLCWPFCVSVCFMPTAWLMKRVWSLFLGHWYLNVVVYDHCVNLLVHWYFTEHIVAMHQ